MQADPELARPHPTRRMHVIGILAQFSEVNLRRLVTRMAISHLVAIAVCFEICTLGVQLVAVLPPV